MELQIIQNRQDLHSFLPLWEGFAGEHFPHLCNSPEWQVQAREHYFAKSPFRVISFFERGRLAGVLPLCRSYSTFVKLPVRKYHFFEQGIGLGDLMLLPEYLEPGLELLWQTFSCVIPRFHILKITCSGEQKNRLGALFSEKKTAGYEILEIRKKALGLAVEAGQDFGQQVLDAKGRREYRRLESHLREAGGFEILQFDPQSLRQDFDALWQRFITIYRRSWKHESHRSLSAREAENRFFSDLFRHFAGRNQLFTSFLRLNGEDAAANWWVNYRGTFFGLQTVFDDRYKQLSPGIFLIQKDIEQLMAQGHTRFDFMGSQSYKKKFSNAEGEYFDLYIFNRGWYGKLLQKLSSHSNFDFRPA